MLARPFSPLLMEAMTEHAARLWKRARQDLYLKWQIFPPFRTKIVTVQSDFQVWEKPRWVRMNRLKDLLRPEPFVESDDKKIQRLTAGLKAEHRC